MSRRAFFIETFGCQMNDIDSATMARRLEGAGWQRADERDDADLVLINTCSVREKPTHKVRSLLGRYRIRKRREPGMVIGVTGCFAQQEKGALFQAFPFIDLVMGTDQVPQVVPLVESARQATDPVLAVQRLDRQDYPFANELIAESGQATALVTIMKGCDNVCSFCIVPYTRGREVSRPSQQVLDEVARLAGEGIKEVTLVGQNVNSYGLKTGEMPFHELIRAVAAVPGIERVRFTTSNPWDLNDGLIAAFAEVPELMPYFHLPVQTGSDRLLASMRREHSVAEYLDKVRRLRAARPGIAFSSDIIVGYPGETEEDFQATLDLLSAVRYDFLYSFVYSPRPKTSARRLPDLLSREEKSARLQRLHAHQGQIQLPLMEAAIGTTGPVLVEGRSRYADTVLAGRLPDHKMVNFPGHPDLIGTVVDVEVTAASAHTLRGQLADPALRPKDDSGLRGAGRPLTAGRPSRLTVLDEPAG